MQHVGAFPVDFSSPPVQEMRTWEGRRELAQERPLVNRNMVILVMTLVLAVVMVIVDL